MGRCQGPQSLVTWVCPGSAPHLCVHSRGSAATSRSGPAELRLYKALPIAGGAVVDVEVAAAAFLPPPGERTPGRLRAEGVAWPAAPRAAHAQPELLGPPAPPAAGSPAETRALGPASAPPARTQTAPAASFPYRPQSRQPVTGRGAGKGGRGRPALPGFSVQTFFSSVSRFSATLGWGLRALSGRRQGRELHVGRGGGPGLGGAGGRLRCRGSGRGRDCWPRPSLCAVAHPRRAGPGVGAGDRGPIPPRSVPRSASPLRLVSAPRPASPRAFQSCQSPDTRRRHTGKQRDRQTGNGSPLGLWPPSQAVALQQERGSSPLLGSGTDWWWKGVSERAPRNELVALCESGISEVELGKLPVLKTGIYSSRDSQPIF